MKKVILGIGVPGSGKTTVLKRFAEENEYTYICPDDIRKELAGDAADQSKNREVWIEAYKRTEQELLEGKSVVFDATFANPDQRKDFLHFARQKGAEKIQGVYVDVDLEIAKERNSQRERIVPEHAIQRMHKNLEDFPQKYQMDLTQFLPWIANRNWLMLK
jgi:predicted kinase